jgi:hypothetical protein
MAIWNILWAYVILNDHLVHFVFIWYIFPVLVSCTKKNLATLGRHTLRAVPKSGQRLRNRAAHFKRKTSLSRCQAGVCCYDHNFFRQFLPIFGEKLAFFLKKNNVMIKIWHNLALI